MNLKTDSDPITLELLEHSPRLQPAWAEALPGWRDSVHPGEPLVEALIEAGVLHPPARVIVAAIQRGHVQARHVPVLITSHGIRRLKDVLAEPVIDDSPSADTPNSESDERAAWTTAGSGEFIAFGDDNRDTDLDESGDIDWDEFASGEFIEFDDKSDADTDSNEVEEVAVDSDDWDSFENGEFIRFGR